MPRVRPATDDDLATIVDWIRQPKIAKWLDFGLGRMPDVLALKYATARGNERLFVFSADGEERWVGVVGLSQIHSQFRTAMLWYALGDHHYGGRGLTTGAVAEVLAIGFRTLGLEAINAWAVTGNEPSQRILKRNGFGLIGRQRRCHYVEGEPRDRLLFDIVRPSCSGDSSGPEAGPSLESASHAA